jgi:hypothetical protein
VRQAKEPTGQISTVTKRETAAMANLSNEQFQQLLETMKSTAISAAASTTEKPAQRNDPAVLGSIRQCILGDDKMKKLTLFEEWLE